MPRTAVIIKDGLLYCQANNGVWLGERALRAEFSGQEMREAIHLAHQIKKSWVLELANCGGQGPLHDAGIITPEHLFAAEEAYSKKQSETPTQKSRHSKKVSATVQRVVIERDGQNCRYCGAALSARDMTFDHVVPQSQGGPNDESNVVACCKSCNSAKKDKTPEQAGMELKEVRHG